MRQKILVKTSLPFDSIYKHIEICHIYQCNQPAVNTFIFKYQLWINLLPELIYTGQIRHAFSIRSFCIAKKWHTLNKYGVLHPNYLCNAHGTCRTPGRAIVNTLGIFWRDICVRLLTCGRVISRLLNRNEIPKYIS